MATWLFALGFVWALPNTLLGLVLGLLTFQVPRAHGGALVSDRRGPRGLTWVLAKMHRAAMTVGFVIVSCVPVEGRLLAQGYRRHPMERRARLAAGESP